MTTNASVIVTTPNDREVLMTRVFDAPRSMVFDCYTKPALLKRWMFPEGWRLVVCDNDLKIGGAYRWEWQKSDGRGMSVTGSYHEIVRPERIVRTELFDPDWTDGETLGTLLLAENDGTTVLTMSVRYSSPQGARHRTRVRNEGRRCHDLRAARRAARRPVPNANRRLNSEFSNKFVELRDARTSFPACGSTPRPKRP